MKKPLAKNLFRAGMFAAACMATVTAQPPGLVGNTNANVAAHRQAFNAAKGLAKQNNVLGAEQALLQLNRSTPNTADWYLESAGRVLEMAQVLAADGTKSASAALVQSALAHLAQAERTASDAMSRASAKMMLGHIQERYLGDLVSALASYRAAAQLAPNSAWFNEVVVRTEKQLAARQPSPGK
jgi:hypothetical protein